MSELIENENTPNSNEKPESELSEQLEQDIQLEQQELELTEQSAAGAEIELNPDSIQVEIDQSEFKRLKNIVESLLLASDKPLTIKHVLDILNNYNEDPNTRVRDKVKFTKKYLYLALDELQIDYEDRAFEVKNLASGYRIQTKPEYAPWVQSLWQEKPGRYSKATLETLAIIAYRQPITRGEIEHIRGVAVSSHIIRTLLDREWIKVVGHRELPGRPGIYATTPQFLTDLNLEKLEDLPTLADIKDIKQDLFSGLENESEQNPEALNLEAELNNEVLSDCLDSESDFDSKSLLESPSDSPSESSQAPTDAVAEQTGELAKDSNDGKKTLKSPELQKLKDSLENLAHKIQETEILEDI